MLNTHLAKSGSVFENMHKIVCQYAGVCSPLTRDAKIVAKNIKTDVGNILVKPEVNGDLDFLSLSYIFWLLILIFFNFGDCLPNCEFQDMPA